MANDPELPIMLRSLKLKREKLCELQERVKDERYVELRRPSLRASYKEIQLWEGAYKKANPRRYELEQAEIEWQKLFNGRRATIVRKLRDIFSEFHCELFDWQALAWALMGTPFYKESGPVPVHQLKGVNNRTRDDWRRLALELTLVNRLFSVEPPEIRPSSRKADRDMDIALRMDALLTPSPETGRAYSPSTSHAARLVYSELQRMEKHGDPGPDGLKDAESLRTNYHGMVKRAKEQERCRSEMTEKMKRKFDSEYRLPASLQQSMHYNKVLSDLIDVAVHWEFRAKASE